MDIKLVAWARAVKARRKPDGPCSHMPVLWLFTDDVRLPDPRAAAAALPRGLGGVVLRHDFDPDRAALGRDLARICRARRLALVVAGDARLAASLGAGLHLREGRRLRGARARRPVTSSAHDGAGLFLAWRSGATLAFLSPAFATASHPGAAALGAWRWSLMARRARLPVAALGGIRSHNAARLCRCAGIGAIGALS